MRFERDEGYFLGAFTVNFGLVLILLAAFIIIGVAVTLPDPPPGKLALMGAALSVVVPIGFYPFSRTFWSAIELWLTPLGADEVAAARDAVSPTNPPP